MTKRVLSKRRASCINHFGATYLYHFISASLGHIGPIFEELVDRLGLCAIWNGIREFPGNMAVIS